MEEQGYDMADEVDKYDQPGASVHFIAYAQQQSQSMSDSPDQVPVGTVRYVKGPRKVSQDVARGCLNSLIDGTCFFFLYVNSARSISGCTGLEGTRTWQDPCRSTTRLAESWQ